MRALWLCAISVLLASNLATTSFSQEAEQDTGEPILNLKEDELAEIASEKILENETLEEETPYGRELRFEPIGAVNEGKRIKEVDAYAQQGIKLGNFIFRPSIEIGLSASKERTNADTGLGSAVSRTSTSIGNENALRLLINSDWNRHELELEANGTVPLVFSGEETAPTYGAVGSLRLDLLSTTTLTLGGEFSSTSEAPQSSAYKVATDPAFNPGITGVNDPDTRLYAGNASLAHDFGGLTTQITAAIGRLEYSEAKLSDGTTVSQNDLNSTDYNLTLRGGYSLSGVLSPFVEANYGVRVMDVVLDSSGTNRNATRFGLRLGATLNAGEKLGGEFSIGYAREKLNDTRFETIQAITLAADLNWSPMRNTDVTLGFTTDIDPSGLANVAGSTVYATELGLSHRLRSNLTATATANAAIERFSGPRENVTTIGGEVGLAYSFNPYLALTGRLNYSQDLSSDETLRKNSASAFVGLRLQR